MIVCLMKLTLLNSPFFLGFKIHARPFAVIYNIAMNMISHKPSHKFHASFKVRISEEGFNVQKFSLSYQEINRAFNTIVWLKVFYWNLFGVECYFKTTE